MPVLHEAIINQEKRGMMWGCTETIGDYIEVTDGAFIVPGAMAEVRQILIEHAADSILYGYWKKTSKVIIVIGNPGYPFEFKSMGWKCRALPVSSMDSFQFHIGRQFDEWFNTQFNLGGSRMYVGEMNVTTDIIAIAAFILALLGIAMSIINIFRRRS